MSNTRNLRLATVPIAFLAVSLPALAADDAERVFRPAPTIPNLVILKTKVGAPDMSLAFRVDESLHTSKLSPGELFRQLLIDMPLPRMPAQASTPRPATDGRGK